MGHQRMGPFRRIRSPISRRLASGPLRALVAAAAIAAALFPQIGRPAEPLPNQASPVLTATVTEWAIAIDLATLPTRPVLVVEATADAAHPDLQLEIEATNWHTPNVNPGGDCPYRINPGVTFVSPIGTGAATLSIALYPCNANVIGWTDATVDVRLRLLSLGANPDPAAIAIQMRGETRPPTATLTQQVDTNLGPRQIVLAPSKDTVLYQNDTSASNGAGQFLWAGMQVTTQPVVQQRRRRALIAFDLSAAIPPIATVTGAVLGLEATGIVGSGGVLSVYPVAPGPIYGWIEGDADAPDPEINGVTSSSWSATWLARQAFVESWTTPGGDVAGAAVLQTNVSSTGPIALSSTAFVDAIQQGVTSGSDANGFLLLGPSSVSSSVGIQLASSEHPSVADRPSLSVDYVQTEIYEDGTLQTGVVSYIDEGQDFRWIYDLDQDDVFVTNVGGICEVTENSTPNFLPYRYSFAGTPGYTGVDCCTWHIDSPQTGTIGTGQALFFHNLDAGNPANHPPDVDQDGIRDLCDNCPSKANGPLLGSCRAAAPAGAPCRSDAECGGADSCDLSQEDTNGDFVGNACPEPGLAVGLAIGAALLASRPRAATVRRRPQRPGR